MSKLILMNILKIFLLLLVADTVVPNCSNFKWKNNFNNNYVWCIVGEWRVIDCRVNNENVHATLWLNQQKLTIDGERIKSISKNKFNITNLQMKDRGYYYCKACNQTKNPARINVKRGKAFAIPIITKRPAEGTRVKYNSTVTLECSVFGSYNDYEMIWFKMQPNNIIVELKSTIKSIWSSNLNAMVQRKRLTIVNFKDNAEYFCRVQRYNVNHVGKAAIQLRLEELVKPVISSFFRDGTLIVIEKNDLVINYSISGTPTPNVSWHRYVNGKGGKERITKCTGATNTCSPTNMKDIELTSHSFVIKSASYSQHHNVTYVCRAENIKGYDEIKFTMVVKTEPRLAPPKSKIRLHRENLHLHCTLSKLANPTNISYSWAYCDKDVNDPESTTKQNNWTQLSAKNSTLKILDSQTTGIRLYRCITENDISTDQLIWTIVRPTGQFISKRECDNLQGKEGISIRLGKDEQTDNSRIEPIVIWQSIVAFLAILLLVTLLIGFRRRSTPKQKCNTCFVPAMNSHKACKV